MPQRADIHKETPSQTAGPYVHIGLTPNFVGIGGVFADLGTSMVNARTRGERITLTGRVIDGADTPLPDCVVEIWQADAAGLYPSPSELRGTADPNFTGWGRCPADARTGLFRFETIKPGRVPMPDGTPQAPHISIWIVARGINLGLNTRLYFPEEAEANAADPGLRQIEDELHRRTLIGRRDGSAISFDIHLQGPDETVFFDI
jgi:protocatechuate 3,4-dioxygenase alpha subunit